MKSSKGCRSVVTPCGRSTEGQQRTILPHRPKDDEISEAGSTLAATLREQHQFDLVGLTLTSYALTTGGRSERNLALYRKAGYRELSREAQTPKVDLVLLGKRRRRK